MVFDFPPFPRLFTIVLSKSYFDILFAHFVKNLTPGPPAQVTRPGQVNQSPKKFAIVSLGYPTFYTFLKCQCGTRSLEVFLRLLWWAIEKCKIRSFSVGPRPKKILQISFLSTFPHFVKKGSSKIGKMWCWHVDYTILSPSDPFRTVRFVSQRCYFQSFGTGLGLVAPPAIYRLFCKLLNMALYNTTCTALFDSAFHL